MSLILRALECSGAAGTRVVCLPDDPEPRPVADLERAARRASGWLTDLAGTAGTVAALLSASHDCLAVIFGAWRAGITLVSLPHPARGMAPAEYQRQVEAMVALTGASHLLVDPGYLPFVPAGAVPVHGFDGYAGAVASAADPVPGRFVQFTSGSTGTPRGIELTLDALDANLASMFDWLGPGPDGVVCSWLPLSHDMGLIGFALFALCSACPPWSTPRDLVLIRPEAFAADPGVWLRACTEYRATSTAAPPFALRFAGRILRAGGARYDLSSVRSFVVGSEPVPAAGLRDFADVAARHGLSPLALCPGYGLAEAALAVTIVSPDAPWSSVRVDPGALGAREWSEGDEGGVELVSCGPALADVAIRTTGGEVGELELASPSLLSRYVGDPGAAVSPEGWFHTADLAHVRAGELFVIGRSDDVFVIAGRNLDARELDAAAGGHPATRPGNCAVIPDGEGRYVVVAEPADPHADAAALRRAGREIRVALMQRFSASPSAVVFIERGTLAKTPSGKVRRHHLEAQWRAGQLAQVVAT